jgi:hypothetical protein
MMRLGAVNRAVWMHKKGGGNQTVQESHTSQKLYLLGASEVTHNYKKKKKENALKSIYCKTCATL